MEDMIFYKIFDLSKFDKIKMQYITEVDQNNNFYIFEKTVYIWNTVTAVYLQFYLLLWPS